MKISACLVKLAPCSHNALQKLGEPFSCTARKRNASSLSTAMFSIAFRINEKYTTFDGTKSTNFVLLFSLSVSDTKIIKDLQLLFISFQDFIEYYYLTQNHIVKKASIVYELFTTTIFICLAFNKK